MGPSLRFRSAAPGAGSQRQRLRMQLSETGRRHRDRQLVWRARSGRRAPCPRRRGWSAGRCARRGRAPPISGTAAAWATRSLAGRQLRRARQRLMANLALARDACTSDDPRGDGAGLAWERLRAPRPPSRRWNPCSSCRGLAALRPRARGRRPGSGQEKRKRALGGQAVLVGAQRVRCLKPDCARKQRQHVDQHLAGGAHLAGVAPARAQQRAWASTRAAVGPAWGRQSTTGARGPRSGRAISTASSSVEPHTPA